MVITLNKTYNNKIVKTGKWKRAPKKKSEHGITS